jgi:hypothetical protein
MKWIRSREINFLNHYLKNFLIKTIDQIDIGKFKIFRILFSHKIELIKNKQPLHTTMRSLYYRIELFPFGVSPDKNVI